MRGAHGSRYSKKVSFRNPDATRGGGLGSGWQHVIHLRVNQGKSGGPKRQHEHASLREDCGLATLVRRAYVPSIRQECRRQSRQDRTHLRRGPDRCSHEPAAYPWGDAADAPSDSCGSFMRVSAAVTTEDSGDGGDASEPCLRFCPSASCMGKSRNGGEFADGDVRSSSLVAQ